MEISKDAQVTGTYIQCLQMGPATQYVVSSGRARAHSTYKESLSEDELQEFEQANGGKVLEKSGRYEEIRECCSSSGEEP